MIKKLLKYDLINTTRTLKYMYLVSLALAIVTRIINLFDHVFVMYIIGLIFAGCTYSAIANVLINTIVHVLKQFMGDFYGDRSYLVHTLPVTKNQLFASKYVCSLILMLVSFILSVMSLALVLLTPETATALQNALAMEIPDFNMPVWGFVTLLIGILIVQICAYMSFGFLAIIKANTYNRKRVLMGFIWFIILYVIAMLFMLAVGVIGLAIFGDVSQLFAEKLNNQSLIILITCIGIGYLIAIVVCTILAKNLFNKGVNVD